MIEPEPVNESTWLYLISGGCSPRMNRLVPTRMLGDVETAG